MNEITHKYITVAYDLFTKNDKGIAELTEQATASHPFQFISGMGVTLDAFEQNVVDLAEGEKFDFTLSVDDAYGPYVEEHVVSLNKEMFCVNGHFDSKNIYPGNIIPLVNADGNRFQGIIIEVKSDVVVVDLNHPLAGKELTFKGSIVTSRPATEDEVKGLISMMSGEGGCSCGCGSEGGCGGDCGGGCDCGGEHDHHHGDGECCGKGSGHHHGEGGCCGKGKGHGHCHHED